MLFQKLGLASQLDEPINRIGYVRPTPVQEQAIPTILDGKDLIACAQTGSGKTGAYILPILTRLLAMPRRRSTRVLVLVPTRELALQVQQMTRQLGYATGLGCEAIYGGVGMGPQTRALRSGVDIIAATPGRLLDHINRGNTLLRQIEILVLDEADRMLDIGFLPDIKRILARLTDKRQTLLFSATMSPDVTRLAHSIMKNPVRIHVGSSSTKSSMPVGITHAVYPVPQHLKTDFLIFLLRQQVMPSVLIFTRTKRRADVVAHRLGVEGFSVACIHSDCSQNQRQTALENFRRGKVQLLVATDIAARGIDVDKISHVINYDLPETPEGYIHRVGRTARAEAKGDAFSLVSHEEGKLLTRIEMEISRRLPLVRIPSFNYNAHPKGPRPQPPSRRHFMPGRHKSGSHPFRHRDSGYR
jgi:ATP-dependent RNA helicase RhlE